MNTTPYWIDSAAPRQFPPLASNLEVDVVVVGGGITGVTAAYLLKEAGKRVALVERVRCAQIDTGHTTAHLTCVTDARLHGLAKTFGDEAARAVWDAGGAGIDQIVRLIRKHDIACDFTWVPGYLHQPIGAPDEKSDREMREEAETARRLGIRAEYLASIPGFDGLSGVHFPHQALFHPRKYLAALLALIPGDGSHVFEETSVDEVGDDLTVAAGDFKLRAKSVVLATHTPLQGKTGTLAALAFQSKLSYYTSYALSARAPAGTWPEGSFWDVTDPYYYLRVERHADHDLLIFGGDDHKTGQEEDTRLPFARLEQTFLSFCPSARIDHRWSGQVIVTNDGLPYIGETAPGQFAATGFAGNGMTFGTLGALMAADAILGRANPWRDLFEPQRKKLLGGTWNYVRENKDYPYHLVRDRLAKPDARSADALKPGEGAIITVDGKKAAAYRDERGQLSLCSPVCTHLQCIVGWNPAERTWDCPCHGSRFTPTGEVISGPAEEPLEKIER